MLPVSCWAEETEYVSLSSAETCQQLASGSATYPHYDTESGVAKLLRKGMKNKKNVIRFSYTLKSSNINSATKKFCKRVLEKAVAHTGASNEGEYLRWNYSKSGWSASGTGTNNTFKINFDFTFEYYLTAEQESAVTAKVNSIIKSMNLDGKDDYTVARDVYDYLTNNISYDYSALDTTDNPLPFTAYGAAINNKAVCQGYSLLMYRILNKCGIDCRMVAANSTNKSEKYGHAWNIIKVGGKYYYADSTWDSRYNTDYKYFLKGKKDWWDHGDYSKLYDYIKNHSLSDTEYGEREPASHKPTPTELTELTGGSKRIVVKWATVEENVLGYQV